LSRELREVILDIGADHEGCRLRIQRTEDSPELGPGAWWLGCEDHDEVVLDFAELEKYGEVLT